MTQLKAKPHKATTQNPYGMGSGYSLIPPDYVKQTLENHDLNPLFYYLRRLLGDNKAQEIFTLFRVGTIRNWREATVFWQTVFWQTDNHQQVRTGLVTEYNPFTGTPLYEPVQIHEALQIPHFSVNRCMFGEHQLNTRPTDTVAIVDNEVAAMIGMSLYPRYVWLASRELTLLTPDQCKILAGRKVALFPRLSGDGSVYGHWNAFANQLRQLPNCHVSVSHYLELNATLEQRAAGLGIEDFLIRHNTPVHHIFTTPEGDPSTMYDGEEDLYEEETPYEPRE